MRTRNAMEFGFWLSTEEHEPRTLVRIAQRAEELGFSYVHLSDHFHPWIDRQGQSPFVWSVIGGIAATTSKLRVGTGVTCPTIRMHPAIVAHAAATSAVMLDGRFFLGVGSGENLNEHVIGRGWPPIAVRQEMMAEAIEIMRLLFQGGTQDFRGTYFTVDGARLYTIPDEPPKIYVAAGGPKAARMAAEIGDGLITSGPEREVVEEYTASGGTGPTYGEVRVCWSRDASAARRLVHELWPTSALEGDFKFDLRVPKDFEDAVKLVNEGEAVGHVSVGPDVYAYVKSVKTYADAGYDHIAFHQVGQDQEGFFRFWDTELRGALEKTLGTKRARTSSARALTRSDARRHSIRC